MSSSEHQDRGVRFPLWADLLIIALTSVIVGAVIWGVPHEEEDLTRRAEAELAGTELEVEFEGRYAHLTGIASTETDLDEAATAIRNLRGVHSVSIDVEVIAIPTASTWGLVVLTLLLLAAGTVVVGHRRGAA